MVSLILLGCYLPLGLLPAILPSRFIRHLSGVFPTLALLSAGALTATLLLARPLTRWLGYTVVFLPVGLSLFSLFSAVAGIRLTLSAWRMGRSYGWLMLLTVAAGLPFLAVSPFVLIGFQTLWRYLWALW
jgi:hypothetical protein